MIIICDDNQNYADFTGDATTLLSLDPRFEKVPGPPIMGQITWKYLFHGTIDELDELLNPIPTTPHPMTRREYEALVSEHRASILITLQKAYAHNTDKLVAVVYLYGPYSDGEKSYAYRLKSASVKYVGSEEGWRDPAEIMKEFGI